MGLLDRAKASAQTKIWAGGRITRNIAGSAKANYRYNKMRSVTQRVYANEALDEEIIVQSMKSITRIASILKGFNKKMFTTIYNAYEDNPEKLHKHLIELLEAYVTYIKEFSQNFGRILEAINKGRTIAQGLSSILFEDVEFYVLEALDRVQKEEFVIPKDVMTHMKTKFNKIADKQAKKIQKMIQKESLELTKVKEHTRLKSGIKSKSMLMYQAIKHKHFINKLGNRSLGKVMEDKNALDEQVKTKINSEYFAILKRYFEDIDRCEGLAYQMDKDLELFLDSLEADLQIVKQSYHTFGVLFKNEKEVKEIAGPLFKQLEILSTKSLGEMTDSIKKEEDLNKVVAHFKNTVPKLLVEIGTTSEKILKDLSGAKT